MELKHCSLSMVSSMRADKALVGEKKDRLLLPILRLAGTQYEYFKFAALLGNGQICSRRSAI
jgi:hypothetical protein